ncbi:uncharacterized protein YukE [Catenuloplanes nepalensis]|uniref:Uncharacterized protein YukE n=1 Tax=Catenuloplanes nepalensis TaxID=587533 RepID=A0ABT9MRK4_9ACTN|nr:hypothetical protein [Catenuloplanes nepalensis]MDP9794063.1 uncharacterized protein YukE [Catenuloplanes nepalensis]
MRAPLWTDFSRWTHEELIRALAAANPYVMRAAADTWAVIAAALHELAQDITPVDTAWTGPAADRHRQMTTELTGGTGTVAAAAAEVRDLMYAASEALHTAWATMPPVGGAAAHRQAVLVMAGLAERYLTVAGALHAALSRLPADPAVPDAPGLDPVTGAPVTGRAPLFGGLMPAGLAATAAAAARIVPPLTAARPGASVPASPRAVGGAGGVAGLRFGGGVPVLPALAASPATGVVSTAAASAPGVAAATGGGGAGGMRGGVPPMIPPMMGGAPDAGGMGRRVPPWLVDTQDVWGETSVVTAAVIGEEPH